MRLRSALTCVAAAVVAVTTSALPAHAAVTPEKITKCGQNITRDAYLAKDLTCKTGFTFRELTLEGPAVRATLDLRGHRLSGTGTGQALAAYDYPFFPTVTVKNGRIDHWDVGVAAGGAVTVINVTLDHNTTALFCDVGCRLDGSILSNNTVGIDAYEAGVVVTGSRIIGNQTGSLVHGSIASHTYTANLFLNNKVGVSVSPYGGAVLSRNVFAGNGIGLNGSSDPDSGGDFYVRMDRNQFLVNGDGIHLTGAFTAEIGRTLAVKNTRYGIYAPGATDLGGNKAAANGKPCVGVVCTKP